MIEVNKLLLLVLGELLLVGIVVSLIIVFQAFLRRRGDRSAIRKLVSRIKEDSGRRESETRKIMQERFGFDGNNLEEIVKKIAREEKAFYQVLIDVYLHHKTDAIQNLCVDYESSVETYRALELPRPAAAPEPSASASGEAVEDSESYRLLRAENERLTEELKKTMDTMAAMLSEYSLMFSGGASVEMDRNKLGEMLVEQQVDGSAEPVDQALPEAAVDDMGDDGSSSGADGAGDTQSVTETPAAGGEEREIEDLDDLQELGDELTMLDLADESLPAEASVDADTELDETMVIRPEESDEVVDLEDVLDDPEPPDDEKK